LNALKEGVKLKRIGVVLFTVLSIILGGCGRSQTNYTISTSNNEISKDVYYTTLGYAAELSDNYMVVQEKGLRIIDLSTKKVIKEIEIPNNYTVGYDIYGTKVVWSAYSSKEEIGKDPGYDETANTDIFLYDIATGKTRQITTNTAGQIKPKVWGDYIVWQDNRNDSVKDKNPEWDIYLYNMSSDEEKLITTAPGIHTNPSINDNKVVWEDGRNFMGKKELRWGENVPENNTDIYMYDIKTGKEEAIAQGPLQECNPTVYGNYIAWEDRNAKGFPAEIYLYDLNKKEKIRVTDDKFNQSEPKLLGKYLVWTDERNGTSTNDVFVNGKEPNSDIFLYDIETKKEYLMTGKEPQIMPAISENYIAYVTSRQINAEIQVVKYK
jgi:beta propeller repeat protein